LAYYYLIRRRKASRLPGLGLELAWEEFIPWGGWEKGNPIWGIF